MGDDLAMKLLASKPKNGEPEKEISFCCLLVQMVVVLQVV